MAEARPTAEVTRHRRRGTCIADEACRGACTRQGPRSAATPPFATAAHEVRQVPAGRSQAVARYASNQLPGTLPSSGVSATTSSDGFRGTSSSDGLRGTSGWVVRRVPSFLGTASLQRSVASDPAMCVAIVVTRRRVEEVVMGVIAIDPLAALPITTAAASAAFARAPDPGRDLTGRHEQLPSLKSRLLAVRQHLDRCDQAAERPASQLDSTLFGRTCSAGSTACRQEPGALERRPAGVRGCPRRQRLVRPQRQKGCGEPSTVVLRDAIGNEQVLCLSHAATTIIRTGYVAAVNASRPDRAVLGEAAGESWVIRRHAGLLFVAQGGPRGG